MVRRFTPLLIALLVFAGIMAFRESRQSFKLLTQSTTSHLYPGYTTFSSSSEWSSRLTDQWEQEEHDLHTNWHRQIALTQLLLPSKLGRGEALHLSEKDLFTSKKAPNGIAENLWQAIRLAPNRPEPYASAIQSIKWMVRYGRPDATKKNPKPRSKDMDPVYGHLILRLAEKGSQIDPSNAYFDLVASDMLIGFNRDQEAMARLKLAGRKPKLERYDREIIKDVADFLLSKGVPRVEADAYMHTYASFSPLLTLHRVILPAVDIARAEPDQAYEILDSCISIVHLLRTQSHSIYDVGTAIAVLVYVGHYVPETAEESYHLTQLFKTNPKQAEQFYPTHAYKTLNDQGWPQLAKAWMKEYSAAKTTLGDHPDFDLLYYQLLSGANQLFSAIRASGVALLMALILSVLGGLLLITGKRSLASIPSFSTSGSITLVLLTGIPWLIAGWLIDYKLYGTYAEAGSMCGGYFEKMAAEAFVGILITIGWTILLMIQITNKPSVPDRWMSLRKFVLWLNVGMILFTACGFFAALERAYHMESMSTDSSWFQDFSLINSLFALTLSSIACMGWLIVRKIRISIFSVLLSLAIAGLLVLVLSLSGGFYHIAIQFQIPTAYQPSTVLLILVLMMFSFGRVVVLSRQKLCPINGSSFVKSIEQCTLLLGKTLFMVFVLIQLGVLICRPMVERNMLNTAAHQAQMLHQVSKQ